jgi:uncharacterized protein (TIGR00297 family)
MLHIALYAAPIVLVAIVAGAMQRRGPRTALLGRKLLHLVAVAISAASPYLIPDVALLRTFVSILAIGVVVAVYLGFMASAHEGRRSWGIAWYAVVYALLLWAFGESHPHLVYYPLMLLALADGAAALAGSAFPLGRYTLGGDPRTCTGSITFAVVALGVLLISGVPVPGVFPGELVFIALYTTAAEAISRRGQDNLWVPASVLFWLCFFGEHSLSANGALAAALLVIPAWVVHRAGWLSAGGAALALLMGVLYTAMPEPRWICLPGLFFAVGSVLTKGLQRSKDPEGTGRTLWQVAANGALPTALYALGVVLHEPALHFAFICTFGAALSDTVSSETGTWHRGRTVFILGFKPCAPGLSGGVSTAGTAWGVLAALGYGALAGYMLQSPLLGGMAALWAVAGNLCDSVLGQCVQQKYQWQPQGPWYDTAPNGVYHARRGLRGVNNDVVNLLAGAVTASAAALWYVLIC